MLTAAHVVDGVERLEFGLMPRGESVLADVVWLDGHRAFSAGGGDFDDVDVGVVEITKEQAARWGVEPTPLSAVVGHDIKENNLAILHGYPAAQVDLRYGTPSARAEPITFASVGVPEAEWDPRYRRRVHQCLRWPKDRVHRTTLHETESATLPTPPGMSGCGIWLVDETPGQLMRPDRIRLAGVQYAWLERAEHVIGNSMVPVVQLLSAVYPELADTLRATLLRPPRES